MCVFDIVLVNVHFDPPLWTAIIITLLPDHEQAIYVDLRNK